MNSERPDAEHGRKTFPGLRPHLLQDGWVDDFSTPTRRELDSKPQPIGLGTDSYFSLVGKSTSRTICRLPQLCRLLYVHVSLLL